MQTLPEKHQLFLQERTYISNVTERSIEWHTQSLLWLCRVAKAEGWNAESPTLDNIKSLIVAMRQKGLKASSVNCRLRSIQAYCRWAGLQMKLPKLKQEVAVLPSFSGTDIAKICRWQPRTLSEHRLQTLILCMVDVGLRCMEATSLKWAALNFSDCLMTVEGKGRRSRTIPFSHSLRRYLFRYEQLLTKRGRKFDLVFTSRDGMPLNRKNVNAKLHQLCEDLRITCPPRAVHALRHSYALAALRSGANTVHVSRMLGHASLWQTETYCRLLVSDLSATHARVGSLVV
jgi:integrase/recombinase XerD